MNNPIFELEDAFTFRQQFVTQFLAQYAFLHAATPSAEASMPDFPILKANRLANKAWKSYCTKLQLIKTPKD